MPFTLSHPAAVLPLRKLRFLPLAALAAGSVAPDTGYFFSPCSYFRENAHTFSRSFSFCLPAGLLILCAACVLRPGLLRLLPEGLREAADSLWERGLWRARRLPFTALAVLVGAWSHLLWDSFTHHDGWFVLHLPALEAQLAGVPAHRLLQHLSTFLGLAALAHFFSGEARRLGRPIRVGASWKWLFWGGAALAATAFTAATLTSPWNYRLAANEHRLLFLAICSCLRNFAVLVGAGAAAARFAPARTLRLDGAPGTGEPV